MDEPRRVALAARYTRFADDEARGRSPLYDSLARGVAGDCESLDFVLTLPADKRQPNLLFAAVRHLFGTPAGWPDFRRALLAHPGEVRSVMLARATQTNEPARCAVLLPVLAALPQPLALIEVGASAGLCLLPDQYGYDYGSRRLPPASPQAPVFSCRANAATPLPLATLQIVWRAGLDLNPLDAASRSDAAWLETLVWPEQTGRLAHLRAALKVAASIKPRVVKGDLLGDDLDRLCREAPRDATLVIFHTAVIAYVADRADRQAFAQRARSLSPYWISNETPATFPGAPPGPADRFLLAVNGAPVAWTDPHGAAIDWLSPSPSPAS
jgi:hypothetical protein